MRHAPLVALLLAVPASATTIPPDLQARADALSRTASPAVLSWAHAEGAKLARATGPVDVRSLQTAVRSSFAVATASKSTPYGVLGSISDGDIEAICFIVLMEASKSAQEDLKAIMAGVKSINNAKAQQRSDLGASQKASSPLITHTPTPAPDRVAQLVTAARGVESRLSRSDLSRVAIRR